MTTRHLVFDLDDTLYAERDFALSGFRAAADMAELVFELKRGTAPALAKHMTELLDNGHLGRSFTIALAAVKPDHTPEQLAAFVAAYREHTPDIALFEDARAALERHGAAGMLGLITDGTHAVQQSKVSALGIAGCFRSIVYTGALGGRELSKPHPRAFEIVRDALGKPGDRFVYIGDNPSKDFQAPNAMGWTTIMIQRPNVPRIHAGAATIVEGAPHHVIASLDSLSDILD
jgi:putative hydrolase of the HAD superfamily